MPRETIETLERRVALLEQEAARLSAENRRLDQALPSRLQFEQLFEASFDPLWMSDEETRIRTANPAFLKLVGCSSLDEVCGRYIWDFTVDREGVYESTSGEQITIDQAYFENLIIGAEAFVEQGQRSRWNVYYCNRETGRLIPTTQTIVVRYGEQGQTLGLFGIIHDLTDIRSAEHRIERARRFLHNIIDTSGDGLLVTDNDGTIVLANKCYAAMLGYAVEELIGRPVYEMLAAGTVDDADLQLPGSIDRLLEEGTLRGYETAHRRRDGSTVAVELNMSCLQDADGSVSGIVSSIRDITERRRAQEALRESEEKYRSLVESLSIGIFKSGLDEQGSILHANTGLARLAGVESPEALIGTPITAFYVNPADRAAVLQELLAQGGLRGKELLFKKPGGELRWASISASVVYDTDGQPVCVNGIIEDIHERKLAEEFLHQSHEKLEAEVGERTFELREANTALRILLQAREEDKTNLERTMIANIQKLVMPHIKKLRTLGLSEAALAYVDILAENVSHIAEPLLKGKSLSLLNLTEAELHIANLIKQKKTTREIAAITGLSPRTIDRHRDNIRKKLGLSNSKINLTTYIMSLS
jgi:PAS domain S-box-containing protein